MKLKEIKEILKREKNEIENPVLTINADGLVGWEPENNISRSSEVIRWEDLEEIENLKLQ